MRPRMNLATTALSVFASTLAACSASHSAAAGGLESEASVGEHCDNRHLESTCAELDVSWDAGVLEDVCDGLVGSGPCPAEDLVGSCAIEAPLGDGLNHYYASGATPWTAERAREACIRAFAGAFSLP